ncbi:MAG: FAD-dependent monooxygenase [Chloroflexi bacterium]|nr:FAD-dependent monooxygenase [Chloroflexota bacterium]
MARPLSPRTPATDRHALVLGGSIAGLLAARVLVDHRARVTIVERDVPPATPAPRKGVTQARHVHVMLTRGQRELERLFPGLGDELAAAGAAPLDWTNDAAWLTGGGWGRRFPSHLRGYGCSRDLLEWLVRRRLLANPQVTLLGGHEVEGLLGQPGGAVTGARMRPVDGGATVELPADLVVDATGRGSRAPRWLADLGYDAPAETVVNAYLGYTSRLYHRPATSAGDWTALYIQSDPPRTTRGGLILPIEGDRWLVTLAGAGKDHAPTDEAGFLAFARGLASPALHDAITNATPAGPIATYRATENRLRHFERLRRWPAGFVVTGDGACAFNPVYGQGMTAAALGALALDDSLRHATRGGDWSGLGQRFQRALARANQTPWLLATGADYRLPATSGAPPPPSMRVVHHYLDRVMAAASRDTTVRLALMEVLHLLRPPAALFHPTIAWRLLRTGGQGPAATQAPARTAPTIPKRAWE